MAKDRYSIGDLVEVTGAKRRSLQVWADRGVIIPEAGSGNAGTGVHRQFSRTEAMIACLIHPFAERQISIGELVTIAADLRRLIKTMPEQFAVIGGTGDTILAYEGHRPNKTTKKHPDWIFQCTISTREQFVKRTVSWPDVMIAIRLETYLAKLD
ncbi:MerR family transcriptional regulator [Bradyrhizobium sp. STM 3557]|uniref:MerR family transcriptional regulator n=1 Tax=Bradyrhizobium sp. STM 3557 TaxID=578920 RepID=UPI00388FD3EB